MQEIILKTLQLIKIECVAPKKQKECQCSISLRGNKRVGIPFFAGATLFPLLK
jgi:hypothetical protein